MTRPNPDELLSQVQQAEAQQQRGKLKIFLGYVAGVGKTYAMLQAAQQRINAGYDLVVAYLETHGRPETEALLGGLEVIPRQKLSYHHVTLSEMDLDAVLARRPQIALVDELAHTNAPGARHTKRYQDVLELLDEGIDVYTTLNIQHLESLNDVVAQITGVIVRETVPDKLIDEAYEIELIDLPTDELRQRLKEGKVYISEQAALAMQQFFRKGNLTALRELTLRRAADRVDEQMRAYMQTHAISGPWPANERLLVCVSPSPLSERLVRAGRRLAARLNAEWFAVYIEPLHTHHLTPEDHARVLQTLRLATSLGAITVNLSGASVAETLVSFAKSRNITKIIVGKPLRRRWQELLHGSVVDEIIRQSGQIDIYVISSASKASKTSLPPPRSALAAPPWRRYAQSILLVLGITLLGYPLRSMIEPTNLVMLYLMGIVLAGVRWGRSLATLTAILSVLAFDFVFVPPYNTFVVHDLEYLLTFTGLLLVGLVVGHLTAKIREQAQNVQQRATHTQALYELSRDLSAAGDLDEVAQAVIHHVQQVVTHEVLLLLPQGETLQPWQANPLFSETEQAVANWAWRHGQITGHGTDTLTRSRGLYLPFKASQKTVAVLGLFFADHDVLLTSEQWHLLEAFASQAALSISRIQLAQAAQETELLREREKLQTALINSISHDLRTPLASITGALSSLHEDASYLDDSGRHILVKTAWEQADRLNHLLGNLLDMTRLEAGAMQVKLEPCDVSEVIGVALNQLESRLANREIHLELSPDLPLVPLDLVLMVQVLVNLLDNALKYSPQTSPIQVQVESHEKELWLKVIDEGIGIPPEELLSIFDKFYRVQRPHEVSGTGLGLSISKGIVEGHGGRIWAYNRPEGGAVLVVAIPLSEGGGTKQEQSYSIHKRRMST